MRRSEIDVCLIAIGLFGLAQVGCSAPPPAPDDAPGSPSLAVQQVARIGCGDCEDARAIAPMALAILDDGAIAVLDRFEPFVRIFEPDGELRAAVGGKGQGPGELGLASAGVGYIPGTWIFANELGGASVVDIFPSVLETFGPDGAFVAQRDTELADAVPMGQAFDPVTRTYFRLQFSPLGGDASRVIVRCDFSGEDTAGCRTLLPAAPFLELGERVGSLTLAATPEGRLIVASQALYRIWEVGDDGEIAMTTGRQIARPRKSPAEIEREEEAAAARGDERFEVDLERSHMMPKGIEVDDTGRIWVLTGRYDSEDQTIFDVFAPDGTYTAEVVVDAGIRPNPWTETPFVMRGDALAGIVRQPDGDDEIWLFRVDS